MRCDCHTKATDESRHHIPRLLRHHTPQLALLPFGYTNDPQTPPPKKAVTRPNYQITRVKESRKNANLHSKALIFEDFTLTGSSNFTDNSLQEQHEIIHVTVKKCHPDTYDKIRNHAERIWTQSK